MILEYRFTWDLLVITFIWHTIDWSNCSCWPKYPEIFAVSCCSTVFKEIICYQIICIVLSNCIQCWIECKRSGTMQLSFIVMFNKCLLLEHSVNIWCCCWHLCCNFRCGSRDRCDLDCCRCNFSCNGCCFWGNSRRRASRAKWKHFLSKLSKIITRWIVVCNNNGLFLITGKRNTYS